MPRLPRPTNLHNHNVDVDMSDEKMWQFRRGAADDDDEESDGESDDASVVVSLDPLSAEATPTKMAKKKKTKHKNPDGEDWANSQQKKDIIAALLDESSGIHQLSNTAIYEKYAANAGWQKVNATANIRRLRNQCLNRE